MLKNKNAVLMSGIVLFSYLLFSSIGGFIVSIGAEDIPSNKLLQSVSILLIYSLAICFLVIDVIKRKISILSYLSYIIVFLYAVSRFIKIFMNFNGNIQMFFSGLFIIVLCPVSIHLIARKPDRNVG